MPTILDLPNELLFDVGRRFRYLHGNCDLCSLSLVNHRFRVIAQETLLCDPCFHIGHIHAYMWELGHHTNFLPKIRRLEIYSHSVGRIDDDEEPDTKARILRPRYMRDVYAEYEKIAYPDHFSVKLKARCWDVTRHLTSNSGVQYAWREALSTDVIASLLPVLLVILPNLRELKLARAWLMDLPIFSCVLSRPLYSMYPDEWQHPFLQVPLDVLASKLECLEFPGNIDCLYFYATLLHRSSAPFDFRVLTKLKYLSVPMDILTNYRQSAMPVDPSAMFPPSLEVLRISEAGPLTFKFAKSLCRSKSNAGLLNLQRVELYFFTNLEQIKRLAQQSRTLEPFNDVRKLFVSAEIELYVYFPSVIVRTSEVGETPWRLMEVGKLAQVEYEVYKRYFLEGMKRGGVVECGWDAMGDVEMIDV